MPWSFFIKFQSILREKSLKPKTYLENDIERYVPNIAREEGTDEEEVEHLGPTTQQVLGIPRELHLKGAELARLTVFPHIHTEQNLV